MPSARANHYSADALPLCLISCSVARGTYFSRTLLKKKSAASPARLSFLLLSVLLRFGHFLHQLYCSSFWGPVLQVSNRPLHNGNMLSWGPKAAKETHLCRALQEWCAAVLCLGVLASSQRD